MSSSNLNLNIPDWTNSISTDFLCPKYGKNLSPKISWSVIKNIKSYALILQDIHPVAHNHIHWYIPSISPSVHSIASLNNDSTPKSSSSNLSSFYTKFPNIKVKQGLNTLGSFGYEGPCAPIGTGNHEYVFYFYALDQDLFNEKYSNEFDHLFQHKTKDEFENLLKKLNIHIISFSSLSGFFNPSSLSSSNSLHQGGVRFDNESTDSSDFDSDFDNIDDNYQDDDNQDDIDNDDID